MNRIISYIAVSSIMLLSASCVKDMQDDLIDGDWNNERSIIELKFKNQVGSAEIIRVDDHTGEVNVTLNVGAITDMSQVEVETIVVSYNATASVGKGSIMDFSNPERTATLNVTSPTGISRTYTVCVNEFRETLVGRWHINNMIVYGGTGPEYGGGRVYPMMDKSWCWYDDKAPSVEYDNTLTFTLDGVTDSGNTYGKCLNDAGADGRYADFVFKASSNPETGEDVDMKRYYRVIPEGESEWVRNYATGKITFTASDGATSECTMQPAGEYVLFDGGGYTDKITLSEDAFVFNINGVDDWTYIYTDYDVFVKKARKFYISVSKE